MNREHTVLLAARTLTAANRLVDVLPAFDEDSRLRTVFTIVPGSEFSADLAYQLRTRHRTIPVGWDEARRLPYELAITASLNGDVAELRQPVLALPHGAGLNKYLADDASGSAAPDPRSVNGIAREQLMHDGRLTVSALALPHEGQLDRLNRSCPEALAVAFIAGDPALDRMLANRRRRSLYRRGMGVAGRRRLVLLSSTFEETSLFSELPELAGKLLAALPLDGYRVGALLHPNLWARYGAAQIRGRLFSALEAGLMLVDPTDGWQGALLAADLLIADHGSVALYAAALGAPVLFGPYDETVIAPDSPLAQLRQVTPHLDPTHQLRRQVDAAIERHDRTVSAAIAERTFARVGTSLTALRETAYRLLDLPSPQMEPSVRRIPEPSLGTSQVTAFQVTTYVIPALTAAPDRVHVRVHRLPAAAARWTEYDEPDGGSRRHYAVDATELRLSLLENAAVVMDRDAVASDDRPDGDWTAWAADQFERLPGCQIAAVTQEGTCWMAIRRAGETVELTVARPAGDPTRPGVNPCDPALFASAAYAAVVDRGPGVPLPRRLTVDAGGTSWNVELAPAPVPDD